MPTYQYRCNDCGRDLEVVQKFTDSALTVCPQCQGALRKVYNAVGVVFKGSGFYRTDSRPSPGKDSGNDTASPAKSTDASAGSSAGKDGAPGSTGTTSSSGSSTGGSASTGSSSGGSASTGSASGGSSSSGATTRAPAAASSTR